jgi:hypothetical protein
MRSIKESLESEKRQGLEISMAIENDLKEEQNKIENTIYKLTFKSKKAKKVKRAFVG